nr:PREDICTED: uncharacterized protein LOC105676597 [Linepithema humile]
MTPSFCWVFLLALVGRARSVPDPVVVDACALLCNPGAETESERARDKNLYPRYAKVNCHPQSVSDDDQAWRIASHCLKLCNEELSVESEVNCFALRSSLGSNLGCYCEALTPLSPNTMRLHESWRLNFLVKELAKDIMAVILDSPLDMMILCEIHKELYHEGYTLKLPDKGKIIDTCKNETLHIIRSRSVDQEEDSVVDKDAVEEIVADEEDKDRVVREVKNLEHSKESDKYSKNLKDELETEMKKNKDKKNTDLGDKTNKKNKDNVENNKKVEKDVTGNSGKDKVKRQRKERHEAQQEG